METERVRTERELKLRWAEAAPAEVKTLTVVPEPNDLEDVPAGLLSACRLASGAFALQRAGEVFDHGFCRSDCRFLSCTRALVSAPGDHGRSGLRTELRGRNGAPTRHRDAVTHSP